MRIATEAWFRGAWRVARLVRDPGGRVTAAFAGTCRFEPDGQGLACRESGVLRLGGARYRAARATLWRFPGEGRVAVLFEDGRPFHEFGEDQPRAVHLCGADRYCVSYRFGGNAWFSRWVVSGRAKHYVMTTRYRRA
jgi:hypothetical protein